MILVCLALFTICLDEVPNDTPAEILKGVEVAKTKFDEDFAQADSAILDKIDTKLSAAKIKGNADDVRELQLRRDVFLSDHVVPEGIATVEYFGRVRNARRTMVASFRTAIARAYAIGNNELAEEINLEFKDFRAECQMDWLQPGDSLSRGDTLISRDGRYELVLSVDGDLVLSEINDSPIVLWTSNTKNLGGTRLTMGYDGNLVLKDRKQKIIYSTNTRWEEPGKLVLQGDGNLVLLDKDARPLWASRSDQ